MLITTLIFYNYFFSAISLKCIEYKKINCYEKYVGQFAIKFLKNPFCWGIRRTDWIYCKLSFWSFKTWWLCTWTELRFVHSYPLMVYRISFKVRSWLFAFAASSHLQSFAAVGFVYETLLKWKCHYIFKINIKKTRSSWEQSALSFPAPLIHQKLQLSLQICRSSPDDPSPTQPLEGAVHGLLHRSPSHRILPLYWMLI